MSRRKKRLVLALSALAVVFLCVEGVGYSLAKKGDGKQGKGSDRKASAASLKGKNRVLMGQLESLSPRGVYIVVDTARNILYLKKGNKTLREMVISAGSGNVLEDPSGKRKWVFDTPRGEYSINSKIVKPDWIKPDWAFIEEGEAIPREFKDRVESGVLGDYALGFGNGYFIHGTLYTRLLGRNITHGCVRVGDEDLKALFKAASIGTKVIIF
jgi:L,D-transpeptidase YbiS